LNEAQITQKPILTWVEEVGGATKLEDEFGLSGRRRGLNL